MTNEKYNAQNQTNLLEEVKGGMNKMENEEYIVANDGERSINFAHQVRGYKQSPIEVLQEIKSRGFQLATARENAAIFRKLPLLCGDGPSNHLSNTGVIYIPGNGICIVDRPEIVGAKMVLSEEGLLERISQGDKAIKFVQEEKLADVRKEECPAEVFLREDIIRDPNPIEAPYARALFGEGLFEKYRVPLENGKRRFIHNSGWLKSGRVYMPVFKSCSEGCWYDLNLVDVTKGLSKKWDGCISGWGVKDGK